jgi:bifunctional DNase/RNase
MAGKRMIEMRLRRIVIREHADRQFLYLVERKGSRGFSIIIGINEANEIRRVIVGEQVGRPLTHQLAFSAIEALGAKIRRCDITDLRDSTYFAQLVLQSRSGETTAVIDARPSDAIALAIRAGAPIRVVESVLEEVRMDDDTPDKLPDSEEP